MIDGRGYHTGVDVFRGIRVAVLILFFTALLIAAFVL